MKQSTTPIQLQLAQRGLHRVPDAAGLRIACESGTLWITLDNDPRDTVLEAGQEFATTEHRPALIYALDASSIRIIASSEAPKPAREAAAKTAGRQPFLMDNLAR